MYGQHQSGEPLHINWIDHRVTHAVTTILQHDALRAARQHGIEQAMRVDDDRLQAHVLRRSRYGGCVSSGRRVLVRKCVDNSPAMPISSAYTSAGDVAGTRSKCSKCSL